MESKIKNYNQKKKSKDGSGKACNQSQKGGIPI